MRKLLGGILAIVAALFLGLAYTQLAVADDTNKACREELTKRILELVESDQSDILQKQFELTTLKLAEATVESGSTTLEDYFRTQEKVIDKYDDTEINERLVALYEKYGENEDQEEVIERYEASKKLARKGSYWRPSTRFKNQDLSAFAYAHSFLHQAQSPFRPEDIAILWLQSEISEGVTEKAGRGSAAANMTEVSTLVARLGGAIDGVAGKDLDALKAAKKDTEAQIGAAFDKVVDQFRNELAKVCPELNKDGKVCADCKIVEETKIGALGEVIHKVKEKLITDTGTKTAKVEKVIAEMQAKGYDVKIEGQGEKKSGEPEQKVSPEFLKMMNQHFADFSAEMQKPLEFKPFRLGADPRRNPFGLSMTNGTGTTAASGDANAGLTDYLAATRGKGSAESGSNTIANGGAVDTQTKAIADSLTSNKGATDSLTLNKGRTDSLTLNKGSTGSLTLNKGKTDSLSNKRSASDTIPPIRNRSLPMVSAQDTGLNKYSTLFWNNDFSYSTPTADTSKTKAKSDTTTTKKVADRQVANEEPLVFFQKPMPYMDYEGCSVHWLGLENGDKASMRFEIRHDKSGTVYCGGKVNMPAKDDSNPGQTLAFRFLQICDFAKTALLTKDSCKEPEAPKK